MKPVLFTEAAKIWKELSSDTAFRHSDFEIEINKQLLNFFQVGDFYYYIFNLAEIKFDLISKEVKTVLGYDPEEVDVPGLFNRIHPEDQPYFLNFENKVTDFFTKLSPDQIPNYKVRYDYRIRKSDNTYIRILQQVITIDYNETGLLRTFGVHTDISHLKKEGEPVLSFIGINGQPSYLGVSAASIFHKSSKVLSAREMEILALLADGKETKEIARELFISPETVTTHRRNILNKTKAKNTPELIKIAIYEGWI